MSHPIVTDVKEKMDRSVQALQTELGNIRTGRANPGILDIVEVDAYGQKMRINQLGTVTVPDAHMLCIDLWDKSLMHAVEKAIMASPLDLNPGNDGKLIRIPIPVLTEQRRKDMVKLAGRQVEEAKVAVRNLRRHAVDTIKKEQKDGKIPEDDAHKMTDEVQKLTDKHIDAMDKAFEVKQADIMEV